MFPSRFFPDSYFAPHYWPKAGLTIIFEPHVIEAMAMYQPEVEAMASYDDAVEAMASEGEV